MFTPVTIATLTYQIIPVPPVTQARLHTAVAAVPLRTQDIAEMAGCFPVSDTTENVGGNVERVLVFGLTAPVKNQFNGNLPLPNNTKTKQWYVVTTSGGTATIGQLIYDDGSGSGTATLFSALTSTYITTLVPFTGGTISFLANRVYNWNGAAWVNSAAASPGGAFQGNFPPGSEQASAFKNLYTHALGAGLGSVVTDLGVVIV